MKIWSTNWGTFYLELKIKNLYSTPHYPQSNGQAEATNKTLLIALKKRLEWTKEKWVDNLPGVLWAYWKTFRRMPTTKTVVQGQRDDNEELERQLDWADEVRGNASIQMASYHQRVIAHYNKKRPDHVFSGSKP
ncbi:hypothetical protein AAG906_009970 [Vitis piasezkii]